MNIVRIFMPAQPTRLDSTRLHGLIMMNDDGWMEGAFHSSWRRD